MQWLFFILIPVAVAVVIALDQRAERARNRELQARSSMDWDRWGENRHAGNPNVTAQVVRHVVASIASAVGVEPDKIHPDDRYDVELALKRPYLHDDTFEVLEAELENRFGPAVNYPTGCNTVEDLIIGLSEVVVGEPIGVRIRPETVGTQETDEKRPRTTASLLFRMCVFMGAGGITAGLLHPPGSLLGAAIGGVIFGLVAHILLPRR